MVLTTCSPTMACTTMRLTAVRMLRPQPAPAAATPVNTTRAAATSVNTTPADIPHPAGSPVPTCRAGMVDQLDSAGADQARIMRGTQPVRCRIPCTPGRRECPHITLRRFRLVQVTCFRHRIQAAHCRAAGHPLITRRHTTHSTRRHTTHRTRRHTTRRTRHYTTRRTTCRTCHHTTRCFSPIVLARRSLPL